MIKRRTSAQTPSISILAIHKAYPAFPVKSYILTDEETGVQKEKFLLRCLKGGAHAIIPLDVCLKSPVRFDPKSPDCRTCFGLRGKQPFPPEFVNTPKEIYLPEMEKVIDGRKNQTIQRKGKSTKKDEKDFTPREEEEV